MTELKVNRNETNKNTPSWSDTCAFLYSIIDKEKVQDAIGEKLKTFETHNDRVLFKKWLGDATELLILKHMFK